MKVPGDSCRYQLRLRGWNHSYVLTSEHNQSSDTGSSNNNNHRHVLSSFWRTSLLKMTFSYVEPRLPAMNEQLTPFFLWLKHYLPVGAVDQILQKNISFFTKISCSRLVKNACSVWKFSHVKIISLSLFLTVSFLLPHYLSLSHLVSLCTSLSF